MRLSSLAKISVVLSALASPLVLASSTVNASSATTVRVNVDPSGGQTVGSGPFWPAMVGTGGAVVAWESSERTLVSPPQTDGELDVFARDMAAGKTEVVDIPPGSTVKFGGGDLQGISPGGRYITFDGCGPCDAYLRDRINRTTYSIPHSHWTNDAVVSSRGRFVAYTTQHGHPVVWDRKRGSVEPFGTPPPGIHYGNVRVQGISAGGRYILFEAEQRDWHNGPRSHINVWVWDRTKQRTVAVDVSSTGKGGNALALTEGEYLSANGRYVMFTSIASNLVPGDTNGMFDVFVRDLIRHTTHRVSIGSHRQQADNTSTGAGISADGRYRLFLSNAGNLIPGDTNHHRDVFLRDRQTGATRRVNLSTTGAQADNATWLARLSSDGHWVAFISAADNLVPGDTNKKSDVFLRGPLG